MYINRETGPPNVAAGFVTQTWFLTYLQYASVLHCCIDIGVLIDEEQRKVVLSVKQKCLNPAPSNS